MTTTTGPAGAAAPRTTYPRSRQILHWLTVALVVVGAVLGFVMSDRAPDDPLRLWLGRAHLAVGMTTGLVMGARVVAWLRSPPVAPLPIADGHRRFVALVHAALYVAAFAVVATGVGTSIAAGWPAYLSGEVALAPSFEDVVLREVHEVAVFALLGLALVHVAGVFRHEAGPGGALRRMLGREAG